MNDADRAIVAAAEERDRECVSGTSPGGYSYVTDRYGYASQEAADRRELLRIVRALEALLRERDTQAEDAADDAAAERATASRWST